MKPLADVMDDDDAKNVLAGQQEIEYAIKKKKILARWACASTRGRFPYPETGPPS